MKNRLTILLKNACKRYVAAIKNNLSETKRIRIYYEIRGIQEILEQNYSSKP